MKKKYFLSILCSLCILYGSFAQQSLYIIPVTLTDPDFVEAIADEKGNTCVLFNRREQLYAYTVPASRETFYATDLQQPAINKANIITAKFTTDSNFIFFFARNENYKKHGAFVISKKDGSVIVKKDLELDEPAHAILVNIISDTHSTYFIYRYEDKLQFGVLRIDDYNKSAYKIFRPEMPNIHLYFREAEFGNINYNTTDAIFDSHFAEKVYVKDNNQLIITFDITKGSDPALTRNYGSTLILTVDWNKGASDYKEVPNDLDKKMHQSNSFLYENKLLRLSLGRKKLNLSVIDLSNDQVINKHHFHDEKITIQSTPVLVKGALTYFDKKQKQVEKQNEIYYLMNSGIPAVSVRPYQDSLLEVTIASYIAPIKFTPGGSYVPINITYFSTGKSSTTSFKSLLNRYSFEFSPAAFTPNSFEMTYGLYLEQEKEKTCHCNAYLSMEYKTLGYFDRSTSTYRIMTLEK